MNNWLDKREFGVWCEDAAAAWLAGKGWHVLERNVRFREGEIDIVAVRGGGAGLRGGRLRFVEVKGRRSRSFGDVVEALTHKKLLRMRRAIWKWRERSGDRRPGEIWFLGVFVGQGGEVTIDEFLVE